MRRLTLFSFLTLIFSNSFALEGPFVSVEKTLMYWPPVDGASGYNIHSANGEYIESVNESFFNAFDLGLPAGDYEFYVVSTNAADWNEWGLSNTVLVSIPKRQVVISDDSLRPVQETIVNGTRYSKYIRTDCSSLTWTPGATSSCTAICFNGGTAIGGSCLVTIYSADSGTTKDTEASSILHEHSYECRATPELKDFRIQSVEVDARVLCVSEP